MVAARKFLIKLLKNVMVELRLEVSIEVRVEILAVNRIYNDLPYSIQYFINGTVLENNPWT